MCDWGKKVDAIVEMLGFMDAPDYWKRMLATSLMAADDEAVARSGSEAGVVWFLPPNPDQVPLATNRVGVGRLFF